MIWTAAAGLLLSAACAPNEPAENGPLVISGRVEGDETTLAAKLPGRVIEVAVREGDRVDRGQVLVEIGAEQAAARLRQAEAGLEAARRQLQAAKLRLPTIEEQLGQIDLRTEQARLDAEGRVAAAESQAAAAAAELLRARQELKQIEADAARYKSLADKGAAPRQAAEQSATQVEAAKALVEAAERQTAAAEAAVRVARAARSNPEILKSQKAAVRSQREEVRGAVRIAEAGVSAAEAVLAEARSSVNDLTVRAPFAGLVVTRAAEPGQVVGPGAPLLTLVDDSRLYLRGFVPQSRIDEVRVDLEADVTLDAQPGKTLEGRIIRIDPQVMFTPENTYFQNDRVRQVMGLKILIEGGAGVAKLGMTGTAQLDPNSGP